jgi:RimJ/RimL family protein N-acetyltransferase
MLAEYPKEVVLQDGFSCILRPMNRDDQDALYRYFIAFPEEDRRYLRNDATSRILIEKWCRELNYKMVLPILAEHQSKILANATLHKETFGWGRHIGEIRITVATEFQQRGLGSLLLEELSKLAFKVNLKKLCAKVVTSRTYVIRAFEKNGFVQEATLKDFVKNLYNKEYEDIAILVKDL